MGRSNSCGADGPTPQRTSKDHSTSVGESGDGPDKLDQAFEGLEALLPERPRRGLQWLRSPKARWVRLPLGLLLIAASMLWFLPVVGIELLPVGLLLIAQDVPLLRRPVGTAILWLLAQWRRLRAWYQRRRAQREA